MTKTLENITQCCKKLRLSSNLADVAARLGGRSNQEYLLKVLTEEVNYRYACRINKYITTAGFPRLYEPAGFRPDEVIFPDNVSLDDLFSLKFYESGRNVIMYGATGTGKTMLSILLGTEACKHDIQVRFFRTAALINQLAESQQNHTLSVLKKKLDSARILILDEFGYVPYDRNGAQLLFDYISEVHEAKSIILNTNLEFAQWSNVLYDTNMTTAFIGRLTHHADIILFPGSNNRLKESGLFEAYSKVAAIHASQDATSA